MKLLFCALVVFVTGCTASQPASVDTTQQESATSVSNPERQQVALRGEYIVQMTEAGDPYKLRSMFYDADAQTIEHLGDTFYLLRLNKDPGEKEVRERVADDPTILMIQPNLRYGIPESEQPSSY